MTKPENECAAGSGLTEKQKRLLGILIETPNIREAAGLAVLGYQLAFFSGVEQSEIKRSLDELHM